MINGVSYSLTRVDQFLAVPASKPDLTQKQKEIGCVEDESVQILGNRHLKRNEAHNQACDDKADQERE